MKIHCRYDRLVPIARLKPHPKNPQRHSAEQVALLAKIILKNGWRRPIRVSERSGYITAGHCALAAARLKGWKTVPVDFQPYASDGLELADLSADNELARLAETDEEILAGLLKDLEGEGIDRELAGLLKDLEAQVPPDAEPQMDRAKELNKKWRVKPGDLWRIGKHHLLCGDCTEARSIERLLKGKQAEMIFTDPPYGHNNTNDDLIHNWEKALGKRPTASSRPRPIANDGPEANELVRNFFSLAAEILKPGCCCCCCCCGGGPDPQFARWSLWLDEKIPFKMCVVWDKGGLGMGWHYRRNWECILVAQKPGAACRWFGGTDVPNVIRDIGKIIPSADQHPTEKPVALPAWFLKLHSQAADVVLDPFLGSGSTMVACENLARRCYGMELAPEYCAVVLQRMADAFGITGQKEPGKK